MICIKCNKELPNTKFGKEKNICIDCKLKAKCGLCNKIYNRFIFDWNVCEKCFNEPKCIGCKKSVKSVYENLCNECKTKKEFKSYINISPL